MREEVKFALNSGFTDSVAVVSKISYLNYDYKSFEIQQEFLIKSEKSKAVDLMKDFRDEHNMALKDSRDDEAAFSSLKNVKDRIM